MILIIMEVLFSAHDNILGCFSSYFEHNGSSCPEAMRHALLTLMCREYGTHLSLSGKH